MNWQTQDMTTDEFDLDIQFSQVMDKERDEPHATGPCTYHTCRYTQCGTCDSCSPSCNCSGYTCSTCDTCGGGTVYPCKC